MFPRLVVEEGVWRDVEDVNVGEVVRGFFEWAFVWGPGDHDVADDPHSGWHGPNDADFKFDKWSY